MKKALYIVVFAMALGTINVMLAKLNVRFDLTRSHQHTLSESTVAVIKDLKSEVNVTVFYAGIVPKYLEDRLKEYERLSGGKIVTETIDPVVQIGYAAQFGDRISNKERKAIVRANNERRDVDFTDNELTEELLTNAVLKVARPARNVYFVTGHGEYDLTDKADNGFSLFNDLLLSNNITAKPLLLTTTGRVPEDCDVLVIAGAKNPLTPSEEDIVKAYLKEGGTALFLIESMPQASADVVLSEDDKKKNPAFNDLLNPWGLSIGSDVVVDLENHLSGDVGCPVTKNYPPHKEIVKDLDYTFFIRPRSVTIRDAALKTIKTAYLVLTQSKDKSWGESDKTLTVKYDEFLDAPGPVAVAAVVWEPKAEPKKRDTRIAVFTDADFLSNKFVTQYSNAELGINILHWLSDVEGIAFLKKDIIKVDRLSLNSGQKRAVVIILVLMPLIIAVLGALTGLKRNF